MVHINKEFSLTISHHDNLGNRLNNMLNLSFCIILSRFQKEETYIFLEKARLAFWERTKTRISEGEKLNLITEASIARHDDSPSATRSCHGCHIKPFFPLLVYPLEGKRVTYFIRLLRELHAYNMYKHKVNA